MGNKTLLCIFAIIILSVTGCTKEPEAHKSPLDYSCVKAVINGRECHMFSGYNCEPGNRTLVGQEYNNNVCLSFNSLFMAEYSNNNDSIFRISILLCLNKDNIAFDKGYSFNRLADSTNYWISQFNMGIIKTPIVFASIDVHDLHSPTFSPYYAKEGWVSFDGVDIQKHLLYGGERWAWKCKEVFFEFEAESKDGRIIHVKDGYCSL